LKVAGRQPSETTTPEQLAWEIEVNRCSLCFPKRNQLYANMPKPVKVTRKRKRGRPATGRDPVTAIRLPEDLRVRVEAWATKLADTPSRSEAIRRLIEIGLASVRTAKPKNKAR